MTATATTTSRLQSNRRKKGLTPKSDQRAAELRNIAVHEIGHCVACVAQGIKVNVIWVNGITPEADTRVRTFKVDDGFDFDTSDGLCDNESDTDSEPWKRLVVDVAGEAAERLHQNLPADQWYESPRSAGDIAFAEMNAAAVLTQRGEDAPDDGAIIDVIEDGYAAAFELLTRHRSVVERLSKSLLTVGLITGDELQRLWNDQIETTVAATV